MSILKTSIFSFTFFFLAAVQSGCDSPGVAPANPQDSKPQDQQVAANTPSSDPMQNKGIGPVTTVALDAINSDMAAAGEQLFTGKCSACHKIDAKYVGPALKDITTRRTPEWVMNMILNPKEMTEKDPIAKDLLAQFLSPMADQGLTQDEARNILEYFRSIDSK